VTANQIFRVAREQVRGVTFWSVLLTGLIAFVVVPGAMALVAWPFAHNLNFAHVVVFSFYFVAGTLPISLLLLWLAVRRGWIGPATFIGGGGFEAAVIGVGLAYFALGPGSFESVLKVALLFFAAGGVYGGITWATLRLLRPDAFRSGTPPPK